jgi:hypothetical protein
MAAEERLTGKEECARDHVLALVFSLFSNVGAYVYTLSLLVLSILSRRSPLPFSRRIQSSLRLAAAARAQTAPCGRANRTSPRSCCWRRSKVEDD